MRIASVIKHFKYTIIMYISNVLFKLYSIFKIFSLVKIHSDRANDKARMNMNQYSAMKQVFIKTSHLFCSV